MTEDLDKDLEDLAADFDLGGDDDTEAGGDMDLGDMDLGDLDLGAADEEGGGDADLGDTDLGDLDLGGAADEESGGDMDLGDADLGGLGGDLDLGGGEEEGGGEMDLGGLGGDLGGGDEEPGGDALNLDDELQSMLDSESGPGGGESAPAAQSAPAPSPPPAPRRPAMDLDEGQTVNLEFLLDIKLHVTFEVGRSKMLISDLLTLGQGSVIELHRLVGDELDLLINGRLVARGEVVVVNEKFGCKITEIVAPQDRVRYLGGL